ncbi:hypothetical protein HWV62_1905 [Athelia sp. TMB]|nr:hypothetical protein HWV62_1905 [Athelia sp. TMB]
MTHLPDLRSSVSDALLDIASSVFRVITITVKLRKWPFIGGLAVKLLEIGTHQLRQYEEGGAPIDLKNSITNLRRAVAITDDSNEHLYRTACLSSLAVILHHRFERQGDVADLHESIHYNQRAIALALDDDPEKPNYFNNLGLCQHTRFLLFGQASDLQSSIKNVQKAISMIGTDSPSLPVCLSGLASILHSRFVHSGALSDLEDAITYQRRVIMFPNDEYYAHTPTDLSNLASSLLDRFMRLGDLRDIDESISLNERALQLAEPGHPDRSCLLSNLASSQLRRFERLSHVADLENAILNFKDATEIVHDESQDKPTYFSHLAVSLLARFKVSGDLGDLQQSLSNSEAAAALAGNDHPDQPMFISNHARGLYARFERLDDLEDLAGCISNLQRAADLTTDGHIVQISVLSDLGIAQQRRFQRLGALLDLESSISNLQHAIQLVDNQHPDKSVFLTSLGKSFGLRFERGSDLADLTASIASFKSASKSQAAYPTYALSAARQWAESAQRTGDLPAALEAYRTALEVLPKVAWIGLDSPSRQEWLRKEKAEALGCLAATCAIQLGRLGEAVELLDSGRSVFWQQVSSFRSDLESLREEKMELATQLEDLARKLDIGSFSGPLTSSIGGPSREETGRERRQLVIMWESLLDQVRQLSGFEHFLKPMPYHQLCQAASGGQVMIVNTSELAVDALIFNDTDAIRHIPLPEVDIEILSELSRDVVLKRPSNGSKAQQQSYITRYLKPALRNIWVCILLPLFTQLQILPDHTDVLPRRRVWWYLTGPLAFIPIHAAGPGMGVSRFVTSSYLTTLRSLLEARKKYEHLCMQATALRLIAISQPDTPGERPLPRTTSEVESIIQMFRSVGCNDVLHLDGGDATVSRVSVALETCSWAHIACHGWQHASQSMNSAFSLHDGKLELGQIACKKLPASQFAFLSACQAASGLKDLPGEAMHLAAALQFSGFSSVVATMWSISDDDAPRVAADIYQYLLRNGLRKADPSEAATALNLAVTHLREDPNVTLDRWAPFVHFGI